MADKIIFLDMDGPMIPATAFFIHPDASLQRVFSPISIYLMNALCSQSGAKIVTNTAHNHVTGHTGNDLRTDLIKGGIDEKYFHADWRTDFPNKVYDRLDGINVWLNAHPDVEKYVCFDDVQFTKYNWLICVDYEEGIQLRHIRQALQQL